MKSLKGDKKKLPCEGGEKRDECTAFSPGRDPGDLGSSPTSGSLRGACFSVCLCLCHFLSVSLMHK
ncbi:unnamed protein product [Nyctereutes procyonoides]|uniref:(raccoon dog) hypothetical protein n=1 Tax=Nyctereutes procyonoides TaxID=34880 RepID=A0A811XZK7_NYCPR|nr:unnamed protein product [Nyctereutes procyonoides]